MSKALRFICILGFALFSLVNLQAQMETDTLQAFKTPSDTVSIMKRQSPKKAALLSTAFPGLGQIYNKKYWKLPIVYGGLAGLGTWVGVNAKNLRGYTNAYKLQLDNDSTTIGSYKGLSQVNQLKIKRDEVKRSLDLSIILTSVFYALNIVDATVDVQRSARSTDDRIKRHQKRTCHGVGARHVLQLTAEVNASARLVADALKRDDICHTDATGKLKCRSDSC